MNLTQKVAETRAIVEDQWRTPNVTQSILFAVSELGEVADAIVNTQNQFARNDPEKLRLVTREIAQTRIMIATAANLVNNDQFNADQGTDPDVLLALALLLHLMADLVFTCASSGTKGFTSKFAGVDRSLEYLSRLIDKEITTDQAIEDELSRLRAKYAPPT